jgi:hypothetical protein
MQRSWCSVAVAGVLALSCKGPGEARPSPQSSAATSAAPGATPSGSNASKTTEGCLTELAYLVPPQKYGDSDLIRAVLVDDGQVFFRDMHDLKRVPLAGGPVATVGKAPALSLRGTTELWLSGDELVMQSPGEPIFMKAKKSGGDWTSFIDLTAAKRGGGRDAATRLLQGLGKPASARASVADFDGRAFYYAEITQGKGSTAPGSSVLKSVPFAGGPPRTVFESPGEISEVTRVGDQLAFHLVLPPTSEQLKQHEAERKQNKIVFGVSGENWVLAVPLAGGEAKRLMRLGSFFSGGIMGTSTILGADGNRLYVSGYVNEDLTKPGVYRIDVASGASEELDKRFVRGHAYVAGERVVIVGSGAVASPQGVHGTLVLTVPRDGKSLTLASCVADKSTLHASAVAGDTALVSLFQAGTGLASIAKLPLH